MHIEQAQPYKLLDKYPGMRPNDEVIWDSFIEAHPEAFDRVWYNVHVGDPCEEEDDREAMIASGAYDVSQWLVDVIGDDNGTFYVIEVKPGALAGALGQALAYKELLVAERDLPPNARPMVITDEIIPITEQAAQLLGVALLIP